MKKQVLFIWYSQTGQLSSMVHHLAQGMNHQDLEIDFCEFKLAGKYPFPWTKKYFFNQMPEVVLGMPFEIKEQPITFKVHYDLIVFAYQPWFLHPSLPAWSIINNKHIQNILANTPVVTLIGARNMWLHAQEKVKEILLTSQASLVGNIVLVDAAKNLASMVTVQRWMFQGKKDPYFIFPAAGIHDRDIQRLPDLGVIVRQHLLQHELHNLQAQLVAKNAVSVKTQLIPLEQRGVTNFRKFARWIYAAGPVNSPARAQREWVFSFLLPKVASLLSPITFVANQLKGLIQRDKLRKSKAYFESVNYTKNIF